MSGILKLSRMYFVLLGIFAVGRWLLGTSGVPYEKAHQVFSIVTLTYLAAAFYGAFCRRWLGYRASQAMGVALVFGLASQGVILIATMASYALGLDTYYNHPTALNVPERLDFAHAVGRRLGGLVFTSLVTGIAGALGWSLGALLPEAKPGKPGLDRP